MMKSSKSLAGLALIGSFLLLAGCVPTHHGHGDPHSFASVTVGTTIPLGGHGHASIGHVNSYGYTYGGYHPRPYHYACGGRSCNRPGRYPRHY
ncbi:hypothetical protein [Thiolinea disciformis]|uniref:hypothetical protein n=1 Tax=Thiolinea disciformis TaxID=125614 RepID=UPI000373342B|nr:hypothetical protein [Thiolinea disciformis]